MRITVHAPVRPTEDPDKVREAATRFFPGEIIPADGGITVVHDDLLPLRHRVWELRIIDTMRGALLHGISADGMSTTFRIAKQAAYAGRVSLPPARHALGDLEVHIEVQDNDPWPDAEGLAWWLCPETKDGEIVGPM